MTAILDYPTPSGSIPGSYFTTEHGQPFDRHMAYDSIFKPPAPSPRPQTSRTASHNRSRTPRSHSSLPRPIATSTASNATKEHEGARKRPRLTTHSNRRFSTSSARSNASLTSTPRPQSNDSFDAIGASECETSYFDIASSTYSRDPTSPPPFVNTSYRLAGGLDTPNASYERRLDDWGNRQEELDWRVNRYASTNNSTQASTLWPSSMETSYATALTTQSQQPRTPSSTMGHRQKRSLEHSPTFETPATSALSQSYVGYSATGWHIRSRAWALTGGLAVKAINFCWNTAFNGFSAGAGQSYSMDIGTPEVPQQGFRTSQVASSEDVFSSQYEKHEDVPGGFPDADPMEDSIDGYANLASVRGLSTPTTRGQHDDRAIEIKSDWCMVDMPTRSGFEANPGVKRRSRASIAGSRSNSFRNAVGSRSGHGATSGASFASPRCRSTTGSYQPYSQASKTPDNTYTQRDHTPVRPSLSATSPYRRQSSYGSNTASSVQTKSKRPQSPSVLSPEIVKYEKRMRKKVRAEDESMARMNAHLQELIRQGKEALGSKISIEHDDDDGDEGFYEEGHHPARAW